MSTPAFFEETASIQHRGPVPDVTVYAHMEFGARALTHPLDTKVVIQLMFMFREQSRQGSAPLQVTPQAVLERLRELGVVSGNGKRLVGRDAVYESFVRLREKGYIRRLEGRSEGGQRTGIRYEFYDNPEWNPDAPVPPQEAVFPQVSTASGIAGSGNAGSYDAQMGTKQRSPQVSTTSGIAGSGNAGYGNAGSTFPQVSTTSGIAGNPPLPPEEVNTSSPYPLTDGALQHPSQTEEEEGSFDPKKPHTPEELTAAADLLEDLPGVWRHEPGDAERNARPLLDGLRSKGWPSLLEIPEAVRPVLVAHLTSNPGGGENYPKLLRTRRVPSLPSWERATRRAQRRTASQAPAGVGVPRRERLAGDDTPDASPEAIARLQARIARFGGGL